MYNAPLKYVILPMCSQHMGIAACLTRIRTRESSITKNMVLLGMSGTVRKLLPEQSKDERKSVKGIENTKQVCPVFSAASHIRLQ